MGILDENLIKTISKLKNEPDWMLEFRLKSFNVFKNLENPNFGPELKIDFDKLNYYKKVGNNESNWKKVSCNIRNTFKELGVIDAEEKYLAGVSNQVESEVIYHKNKSEIDKKNVIFLSTDDDLKQYPELFKKYFNSLVKFDEINIQH